MLSAKRKEWIKRRFGLHVKTPTVDETIKNTFDELARLKVENNDLKTLIEQQFKHYNRLKRNLLMIIGLLLISNAIFFVL